MSELAPKRSQLLLADVLAVGSVGLRTRKLRASLSALGIAIGIAALVAVLGISGSSQADLLSKLDALGTNLLTVQPGQSFVSQSVSLPSYSTAKTTALGGVQRSSAVYTVDGATVRRSKYVEEADTSGIAVEAADLGLDTTLGGEMASGSFLTNATERYPTVVLGSVAAQRLGIRSADGQVQVYLGGREFTVVGILRSLPLAPEVDRAALIGLPAARSLFDTKPSPSTIYVRADPDQVTAVHDLLPATAYPEHPEEVDVSQPSDALEARVATKSAFTGLFLGLGAVALLVGGVGIANVMVISVLERRAEVGLRRALGASRRHVTTQFLVEALLLGALGGAAGVILGSVVTLAYALASGLPAVFSLLGVFGGLATALMVAAVAGLYPATRAAKLSPTEALRTV